MNKKLKITIKILLAAIIIFLIVKKINFSEIKEAFNNFNFIMFLPPLVLLSFSLFIRARVLQILLKTNKKSIKFLKIFKFLLLSNFLRINTPANLGQFYILKLFKNTGIDYGYGFSVFLVNKLLAFFSTFIIAIFGLFAVYPNKILIIILLAIICAVLIFMFSLIYQRSRNFIKFFIPEKILKNLGGFSKNLKYILFENTGLVVVSLILIMFTLFINAVIFYILFTGFSVTGLSIIEIFLVANIVAAICFVPITLDNLGIREGAGIFFYSMLGISQPVIFSAFVLYNVVRYTITFSGALISKLTLTESEKESNER